jgi:hypothetical protein
VTADALAITATSVNALTLTDGTASFALGGTGATTLSAATTVDLDGTGAMSLNSSGGVINIGNDAVAQAINVGVGAAARTVTVGNTTGATALDINLGTGGMTVDATDGGAISLDANGAPSNLTLASTADGDDLTINVTGSTNSSLVLKSTGTGADAVELTSSAGGVKISANSGVDFDDATIASFSASTVTITGATTLTQADHNGKVLICNSSSDIDLSITANSISAGFNCLIVQTGAGKIIIDDTATGVTVNNRNSHTKTSNRWAIMTLLCVDNTSNQNVFISSGDGAS